MNFSGSTAQGEVTESNQEFMDWTDDDKFEAHVEGKLGSFNVTIPGQAMELYNVSDHWQEYASMISDIRTVCPLQELAQYVSQNFVSKVFSYVATQKRADSLGGKNSLNKFSGTSEFNRLDISVYFYPAPNLGSNSTKVELWKL